MVKCHYLAGEGSGLVPPHPWSRHFPAQVPCQGFLIVDEPRGAHKLAKPLSLDCVCRGFKEMPSNEQLGAHFYTSR